MSVKLLKQSTCTEDSFEKTLTFCCTKIFIQVGQDLTKYFAEEEYKHKSWGALREK